MKKKALLLLAEGFEEVEAITPLDILRRCDVDIKTAGLKSAMVKGAHGVVVETDTNLQEFTGTIDALILPGGMPGAENLASSVKVKDMILKLNSERRIIAAICASPVLVLEPAGILSGRKAVCYPGMEKGFSPDVKVVKDDVVVDGNIITSRGPWTAFAFGLKIAELLIGKPRADMVGSQMLCPVR